MQTLKNYIVEASAADAAKKKLKGMKGKEVSFTHTASGKKVTGTYKGLKQMGGRSYAHIETGKEAHRVPPHHIHQVQESVMNEAKGKIIHQHSDGTIVHHSEEDRGEVYTVGNKKTGGLMSSETHTIRTHHYKNPGETVAGNVKKHIQKQAPGIPSHAKTAIQKHMASM